MLVLSRKRGEQIQIGTDVTLTVVSVRGHTVKLSFNAPRRVPILRSELLTGSDVDAARKPLERVPCPAS